MQEYNLHLKGYVGDWDFDADYVDYVLEKHAGKPVNVLINSLGGSVHTALSIAAAFRRHGDVSVHFAGMNASAATIASLGAKRITMDGNAMYLAHKCSAGFFAWGSKNSDELAELLADVEKLKEDLDKFDLTVARMYAKKCKKKPEDLLALMQRNAWLTADEALAEGLVDELTDFDAGTPVTGTLADDLRAAGLPVPDGLNAGADSAIQRLVAFITAFFKPFKHSYQDMNTEPVPAAETAPEAIEQPAEAVQAEATEVEAVAIEAGASEDVKAALEQMRAQCAALAAELAELKAAPGASTTTVVDDAKTTPETDEDPLKAYVETACAVRAWLKTLP